MSRHYKRRLPPMPCIDQALSEAVIHNDMVEVRRALQAGAFVNGLDREGLGAIHQAIYENNFDVLRLLVRHGADVRLRDSEGWTPLHTTAQTGNCDMARFLLKEGANTDAVDGDGLFPIDRAERSDMRSLLYKAMKRAGHVQLSDQYRSYLEQERSLETSLGDSDSLCSSVSAYSLSMSEDEGQFSQSDGDELHGLTTHVIPEEKIDTPSVEITRESLPTSEELLTGTVGDKADASLTNSRNTGGRDEIEIACRLVRVTAFDNASAIPLVSVEFRVQKDVHCMPEVSSVIVGECPHAKEEGCQKTLLTDSEESAEMLHYGLSREGAIKIEDKKDVSNEELSRNGSHMYVGQLLDNREMVTRSHSQLIASGEGHMVSRHPSVNKQESHNEQADARQFVNTTSFPEIALSRSQLKAARAAFFFSAQMQQRNREAENKRHSLSPSANKTVCEMNSKGEGSNRLARELPIYSSLSSASLQEKSRPIDKEHSRLRWSDPPVSSNERPPTVKDATITMELRGAAPTNHQIENQSCGLSLQGEADRHKVVSLLTESIDREQEAACLQVVRESDKAEIASLSHQPPLVGPPSLPAQLALSTCTSSEAIGGKVISPVDLRGHLEEGMCSQLETSNVEQICVIEKLEAQRNVTEIQEATIKECVNISKGVAVESSVVNDGDIHWTKSSLPQTNVQSFGWESDSDDDCFCEETIVFFREDESGDLIRRESDAMSGSSLFSPDRDDSPPISLHSSTDPDELLSVSSEASDDRECELIVEDPIVNLQTHTSVDKMSDNVDSDEKQVSSVKQFSEDNIEHLSKSGDSGDDMTEEQSVRTSPPCPQSLQFNRNTTVSRHHLPPLKSITNRLSLPNLTSSMESRPILQNRPRSLHGRSVSFEPLICFQDAVVVGNMEEVKSLIRSQSVNLDAMTPQGYTVLHAAAIEGNIDCVEALIGSGAKVNIQDEDGWTPLHAAASHGHLDIIQYLLKNGADSCIVGNNKETAYDVVDDDADSTIEVILKNAMGDQFDVLVTNRLHEDIDDDDEHSEDGDDEESGDEEPLSPVDYGDDSKNSGTLFQISRLTQAADIGKWLSHSAKAVSTGVHESSETTHYDQGKDVTACSLRDTVGEAKSKQNISEVYQRGKDDTLSRAMSSDIDINMERTEQEISQSTKSHRGVLVLKVAPSPGTETPDILSPKSVSFPPNVLLQQAVADGDVGEVDRLLTHYTTDELQINNVSLPSGVSVLHQSVNIENLAVTKLLIEKGSADPSLQDNDGWTPLHNAAAVGSCDIARYLISHGAKLSVLTAEGQFPSDVAEKPEMLSLLRNAMLGRFWGTSFKGSL